MDFEGYYYLPRGVHEIGFRRKMSPCHVDVARLLHIVFGQRLRPHKDGNGVPKSKTIHSVRVTNVLEFNSLFLPTVKIGSTVWYNLK